MPIPRAGVNSFVTLFDADNYFDNRSNATWREFDTAEREGALITASKLISELPWRGRALSATQQIALPRSLSYTDPSTGHQITLTNSDTPSDYPERVLVATYEQAHHLLTQDAVLEAGSAVGTLSAGSVNLQDIRNAPSIHPRVRRLLAPLIESNDPFVYGGAA